jgi:hypothetical protein
VPQVRPSVGPSWVTALGRREGGDCVPATWSAAASRIPAFHHLQLLSPPPRLASKRRTRTWDTAQFHQPCSLRPHHFFSPTLSPKAGERMRHPARNGNAVESVLLGGSPRIYAGEGALQRSGKSSTSICALAPGWRNPQAKARFIIERFPAGLKSVRENSLFQNAVGKANLEWPIIESRRDGIS